MSDSCLDLEKVKTIKFTQELVIAIVLYVYTNVDSSNWPPDKKRKRSRWGGEETKTVGVASVIPSGLNKDQEKQVLSK